MDTKKRNASSFVWGTFLILFSLLATTNTFPSHADSLHNDADFSAVDAYVEAQMKTLKIPGLALAIVQGDQVVYVKGYGQAHPDGSAVTSQTPFMIGSTTKSITALAVMQLVEAGKIELGAPVQTYIPWFRVADGSASAQITVKQLLIQTSGFSGSAGRVELAASDTSEKAIENSVRALKDVALVRAPGAAFEYSNANYTVLGLVVQMVSGQSYESYIQEHIFDPLAMSHSYTSLDEARRNGVSTGYSTFFGLPVARDVPFNRGNIAGGYLVCSAEDLAHYLIAQLNEGRYGNGSVISPQGMDAMHQPLVNTGTPSLSYGMGWFASPVNGVPAIWHDGDNANYSSNLMIAPQEKLGIVVLTNVNGTFVLLAPKQIATGVQAILRGKQPQSYERLAEFSLFVASTGIPALLSLLWVGWMAIAFVRRQKRPIPARHGFGWWVWVIGVPAFVDLILLVMSLMIIPKQWGMSLNTIAAWYPDCFLLLFGGAILVAVWGVVRPALTLRWARNQRMEIKQLMLSRRSI
jgi:CubicO group peptidase (beta-lactamase class C family)